MTSAAAVWLALAASFAWIVSSAKRWKLARDTGVHRYYEHTDGRRRVFKVGRGHQPVDRRWLGGEAWIIQPRPPHQAARFSLRVDDELLEATSFEGIIRMMRERGHSNDDVLAAALVIHRENRGAELRRR